MHTRSIAIGIIGTGGMGGSHALNLSQQIVGARLVALCDVDQARLADLAREVGKPRLYSDPLSLIDDPLVEAVIVASPDATHAQYVLHALSLGKPVFCEKPLASTEKDALAILLKEVAIGKKLVSVGFNRRFDPWHQKLKEQVASKAFGLPLLWKGFHRNPSAMYNTGGPFILNNSAGHDVDCVRWILDSSIVEVQSYGIRSRSSLPDDARDLLIVNMLMENGSRAIAEVYVNASYGYEVGLEVVCQEGSVSILPIERTFVRSKGHKGVSVSDDFRAYFADSYLFEMQDWVNGLLSGTPFGGSDAWDGYAALVVTEAAGKSLVQEVPIRPCYEQKPPLYRRETL